MDGGFERLVDDFGDVLDGPVWDGAGVLFCCPGRNAIHRWDAHTRTCALVRHPTVRIRGLAFAPDGRLFAAQSRARRVVLLSDDGGTYYLNAMLDGRRHNDPQDLVVDRAGRIWFTDRHTDDSIPGPVGYPPLEHQSVLRLTEHDRPGDGRLGDWALERMTFDTCAPSGIALSPDEATLYVVDRDSAAERSRLKAYRVTATGRLGPPRVLHEFDGETSAAGMCVDRRGQIVVTTSHAGGGGALVVFAVGGSVQTRLPVDDAPTNCCYGGFGGATLFVTTGDGRLLAAAPLGGVIRRPPPPWRPARTARSRSRS
jgi:gluconolactonase